MQPTNNARLRCFSDYVPITNISIVDEEQMIYRGERVVEIGTASDALIHLFFSRSYDDELSDFDKMFKEIEFDDSLLGFQFTLVPKHKILFGYDEPSSILKPNIPNNSKRPFQTGP